MSKKRSKILITLFSLLVILLAGSLTFTLYKNQAKTQTPVNSSDLSSTLLENKKIETITGKSNVNLMFPWLVTSMGDEPSSEDNRTAFEMLEKTTTILDQSGQKVENANLKNVKDLGIFENQVVIQNNDDSVTIWNLADDSTEKITRQELTPKDTKIDTKYLFFKNFKLSQGKLYYNILENYEAMQEPLSRNPPVDYVSCQDNKCGILQFDLRARQVKMVTRDTILSQHDGMYHPELFSVEGNNLITNESSGGGMSYETSFIFKNISTLKIEKSSTLLYTGNDDIIINLDQFDVESLELSDANRLETDLKCVNPADSTTIEKTKSKKCKEDLYKKIESLTLINSDIKQYLLNYITQNLKDILYQELNPGNPALNYSKDLTCGNYKTSINLPNSNQDGLIHISYKDKILPGALMGSSDVKCLDPVNINNTHG